jgi:hypothetical protein
MSTPAHSPSLTEDQSGFPSVQLSYECIQQERAREAAITRYEVACSITYPTASAHLSISVTGQHTYRNAPTREVPFTRHAVGATTYVELLEREQLEIRIVEHGGAFAKAIYSAHEQTLTGKHLRRITSTLHRIEEPTEPEAGMQKS